MDSEEQPRKLRLDVKECAKAAAEEISSRLPSKINTRELIEQRADLIAAEFADIDWDREMANGCLIDIHDTLLHLECCHGKGHDDTPPMMYSDWILCIVAHERRKAKAIQDELDALKAVRERERNGL